MNRRTGSFNALLTLLMVTLLIIVNSCDSLRQIGGPEPGRHRISIIELALSESDFTNSALGTPKAIELFALKDGAPTRIGRLEGFRGPKKVGVTFELDYDPHSRYEFKIQEAAVLTEGRVWTFSSPRPGTWVFKDRQTFGSGSSVTFADEKVQ